VASVGSRSVQGSWRTISGSGRWAIRCSGTECQTEESLHQALTIPCCQGAKSLELWAALSLRRLWQQGKWAEARALVAPIYGWFTEGFDTADLREAKALVEELA
jgi:predicted ATPase